MQKYTIYRYLNYGNGIGFITLSEPGQKIGDLGYEKNNDEPVYVVAGFAQTLREAQIALYGYSSTNLKD